MQLMQTICETNGEMCTWAEVNQPNRMKREFSPSHDSFKDGQLQGLVLPPAHSATAVTVLHSRGEAQWNEEHAQRERERVKKREPAS